MKKRAVSLFVVFMVGPALLGLSGCKTRPPDPPAKKIDPLVDPLQPPTDTPTTPGGTTPAGTTPGGTTPGGTTPAGTTPGGSSAEVNITPVPVDSFIVPGMSVIWINTKKTANWAEAKVRCTQYGTGWNLPSLIQLTQLDKLIASQDPVVNQATSGLTNGRYWTADPSADGKNYCAQATTSTNQTCDGFEPGTSLFNVLCVNP